MNRLLQFRLGEASEAEVEKLRTLVHSIALKYGMADTTVTSRAERTVANFSEKVGSGFALAARIHGSLLVVEISSGRVPTPRFSDFLADVSGELRQRFGKACVESTEADWIPVRNVEITPEHAQRIRAFFERHPMQGPTTEHK